MCVGNHSDSPSLDLNMPCPDYSSLELDHCLDTCDYISLEDASLTNGAQGDLSIMQLNVHGLLSKEVDLSKLVNSCIENSKVDIVILCETLLNPLTEHLVNIPCYSYTGKVQSEKKVEE